MSKWGYVTKRTAKEKFERQPDEAFEMVEEMGKTIIDQENEKATLNQKIQDLQMQIIGNNGTISNLSREIGRLEGYRDRVREVDGMEEIEE